MDASCMDASGCTTTGGAAPFTAACFPGAASARFQQLGDADESQPLPTSAARPTVADVLRQHVPPLLEKSPSWLTSHHRKVLQKLIDCRTTALGGHGWKCDWCGVVHYSNESCNNRHCPTCGGKARRQWLEKMLDWSLATSYFHVVFTLPHEFYRLIRANPRELYRLLFQAAQQALLDLGKERLGVILGVVILLHTWGQKLNPHVHLHALATGGGLSLDGTRWISAADLKSFISQSELAERFRECYLHGLRRLYRRGELIIPGSMSWIKTQEDLEKWLLPVKEKDWNVHCQAPPPDCEGPQAVLKYLARYVSGTAIHDGRMVSDDGVHVTFMAKNYRQKTRTRQTVTGEEFVSRFVAHILPPYMRRIRYSGLFSPGKRKERLPLCRQLLAAQQDAEYPLLAGLDQEQSQQGDNGSGNGNGEGNANGKGDDTLEGLDEPEPAEPEKGPTITCPRCGMPGMRWFGRFSRFRVDLALSLLALIQRKLVITTLDVDLPTVILPPADPIELTSPDVQFVLPASADSESVALPLPHW